jgi:hypothetical protein
MILKNFINIVLQKLDTQSIEHEKKEPFLIAWSNISFERMFRKKKFHHNSNE